ncbi:MAG TPA: ABC transporter substrate-binding protein [Acidimicrobiales bacterium]
MGTVVALVLAAGCGDGDDGDGGGTADGGASGAEGAVTIDLGPTDEASGESVRIGFISDGRNATTDQSVDFDVADATVAYLNTHRGGIAGRPIEIVPCEAQLDPAVATDCANRMVEEDVVAVVVGTTAEVEQVWEPLHQAGVPAMFFAAQGDAVLADAETTFGLGDPTASTVGVPISVAEANDVDKVTVVVIDVPPAVAPYESVGAAQFEEAGIDLEIVAIPPGTADMTAQLTPILNADPGVVHVLGNDAFCIAAFQAMETVGFDGPVTSIPQCITDATRDAVPGAQLEGITVGASSPVDANDESDALYRTVMAEFGDGIDTSRATGHGAFTAIAGLDAALEELTGEVTRETVLAAIRSMPETELPNGGGLTFRCSGDLVPGYPAACVRGTLVTTLDAEGRPTTYEARQG